MFCSDMKRGLRFRIQLYGYWLVGTVRETGQAGVLFDPDPGQVDEGTQFYEWDQIFSRARV